MYIISVGSANADTLLLLDQLFVVGALAVKKLACCRRAHYFV